MSFALLGENALEKMQMKAMILRKPVDLGEYCEPLELVDLPIPTPKDDEILLKVLACGVCHTELDEIEGRLKSNTPVVPGHEVIGQVVQVGSGVAGDLLNQRMGVGWIHHSNGTATENLSPGFRSTGCDVNGGYAQYMVASPRYAYPIPDVFSDEQAAPLLCAGAIGYRALKLTGIENGQRLGLTGFGGSAHLVAQLAAKLYPDTEIYVFARDEKSRTFARELGAAWAGKTEEKSPELLDAIIDTTPAWKPVVEGLKNLSPGGRLVINAIRKEDFDKDYLQNLSYHEHLWMEREIKSVANITHFDIEEFLPLSASIPIQPTVETFKLEEANRALIELKRGTIRGVKVLKMTND